MVNARILKKAARLICKPIEAAPITYMLVCAVLFVPEFYGHPNANFWTVVKEGFLCNLQFINLAAMVVMVICFLVRKISHLLGNIACSIALASATVLTVSDLFVYHNFGTHINAYILQLIHETNAEESSEFVSTYLFSSATLYATLLLTCMAGLAWGINTALRYLQDRNGAPDIARALCMIYLVCSVAQLVNHRQAFSQNVVNNHVYAEQHQKVMRSFVYKLYNASLQFFQEQGLFDRCSDSLGNIDAQRSESSPHCVVLIIGESHNKYHSSLYGYRHETNPLLAKEQRLTTFTDVICSVNATSQSFKNFLSTSNLDDEALWCDEPLFPAIFKAAGYNVTFYSNQFVHDPKMDLYDASCGFVNHPSMRDKLFSHKNTTKFQYDEELVEDYFRHRSEIETDSFNLVMFHLKGQHVSAAERYPSDMGVFTADDYGYRTDLTQEQKEYVAHYDNATLYNDYIIETIIDKFREEDAVIIYFSDHGDEVYDFRDHIGRSYDFETGGVQAIHHQMDVPFLVCVTEKCAMLHPELAGRISQAADQPYMTDDLPHTMLDIAAIETTWYRPERSIINPRKSKRNRVGRAITPTVMVEYDALNKR